MRKLFHPGNIRNVGTGDVGVGNVGIEGIPCMVAAGFVFLGFYYGGNSVHNTDGRLWGTNAYNYIVYILTIIAAMSGYCCTAFLLKIKSVKRGIRWVCAPIYLLFLLASFYFLWNVYKYEATEYAGYELRVYSIRENVQHWVFALLMGIMMAGCICILRNIKFRKEYLRWVVMCSAALISAALTFAPNTFLNDHWGLYHTHAYENTIVNVARLQPFTELNRSIYGHYALLYLPLVKVFGDNMVGVACAVSVFTFVTYLCSFYIAHKTIKNDGTFVAVIMAIGSIGTLTYGGGQYFQVLPQRLITQTIILAYITYKATVSKPLSNVKTIMFDLLLSVFAFTMGIEGGVITFVLLLIYRCLTGKRTIKHFLAAFVLAVFIGLCAFIFSYFAVNLYNLLVGGSVIGIRVFLYPFMSEEAFISGLRAPLPGEFSGAVLRTAVFTVFSVRCFFKVLFEQKEKGSHKTIVNLMAALSGLAWFMYYINRTAVGNLAVSQIPLVLLMGTLMECIVSHNSYSLKEKEGFRHDFFKLVVAIPCTCLVLWNGIEGAMTLGKRIENRAATVWNMSALEESIELFQKEVPRNTMAFGPGMPELYYQMGWDPQVVLFDFSDPPEAADREAFQKIFSEQDMFVAMDTVSVPKDFEEIKHIETPCFSAGYYVRKK